MDFSFNFCWVGAVFFTSCIVWSFDPAVAGASGAAHEWQIAINSPQRSKAGFLENNFNISVLLI